MEGWVKLHRKVLDSQVFQNEKLLKTFVWCMLKATHKKYNFLHGRQKISLKPGQFITGRKKVGEELGMHPSTAWAYLKFLEDEKTLDIKSNNRFSLISIVNWGLYQDDAETANNKPDNEKTTRRQQKDTYKNVKKEDIYMVEQVVEHLNKKTEKNYKPTTMKTITLIRGRMREGFTYQDFKSVIDIKAAKWMGGDMEKYLRPETLFGTKFEAYLNQRLPTRPRSGDPPTLLPDRPLPDQVAPAWSTPLLPLV